MQKVILITGSTDGIGFETAKVLVQQGHHVLLHGRNPSKLKDVEQQLVAISDEAKIQSYVADLSVLADVDALADEIIAEHDKIDVLINNAGV
ncbi:SDR family NAD(P)-dependent oxidoreductase, partial [Vibrio splendidus]